MGREINQRKAAIIGCGFVGSATAFTLMQSQLFSELVLVDVDFVFCQALFPKKSVRTPCF